MKYLSKKIGQLSIKFINSFLTVLIFAQGLVKCPLYLHKERKQKGNEQIVRRKSLLQIRFVLILFVLKAPKFWRENYGRLLKTLF